MLDLPAATLLARLLRMRSLNDDEETVLVELKPGSASAQPAYMRAMRDSCSEWLGILPTVRSFVFFPLSIVADSLLLLVYPDPAHLNLF